jgi:hypothetical protein
MVAITHLLCDFFFLVGLGFELSLTLTKQVLYSLNHTSSPFCSGYFGDKDLNKLLPQAGLELWILPISLSRVRFSRDYKSESPAPICCVIYVCLSLP